MDGNIAKLDEICDLADKYDALVMIDDAHATGFIGKTGRGSQEYRGVMGRVDIITGTLGKALGGASGGFISGRKELIELYRQRSRPYLFSNTVAPAVVGASIAVLDLLSETTELRDKLENNTKYFREKMTEAGFEPTVYWEGTDEEQNEGNGIYMPSETGDADPGWVCYIVAQA